MHKNAFGGRAPPGPAGGAYKRSRRPSSRKTGPTSKRRGGSKGKGREEAEGGVDGEGKRKGRRGKKRGGRKGKGGIFPDQ